jgi:hypothetical protein
MSREGDEGVEQQTQKMSFIIALIRNLEVE